MNKDKANHFLVAPVNQNADFPVRPVAFFSFPALYSISISCIFSMTYPDRDNYLFATLFLSCSARAASLFFCAACVPVLGGCTPRILAGSRANQVDGKALYAANCASCHGEDGRNDRQGANPAMRLSAANALPDSQWNRVVVSGRGEMPAFRSRLSTQELRALRDYAHLLPGKITTNK